MSLRKRILIYSLATALLPSGMIVLYPLIYPTVLGPFFAWVALLGALFMVLLFLNIAYLYKEMRRIYEINDLLQQMSDERPIKVDLIADRSNDELSQLRNSITTMYQKMESNNHKLNTAKVDLEMKYAQSYTIKLIQEEIGQELETDQLLGKTADVVLGVLGGRRCSIYMFDEARNLLVIQADSGFEPTPANLMEISSESGILVARSWRDCKTYTKTESAPQEAGGSQPDNGRTILTIPLRGRERCLGVMALEYNQNGVIGADLVEFAESIAKEVTFSVENAYLYDRMKKMAIHDGLTGAYNRVYLMQYLKQFFLENPQTMSLIMLDLDHFKKVNDRYGHLAGDMVLKTTVQVIQKLLLSGSVLARYGGEEFVVVLPEIDQEEAVDWANLMRLSIAKYNYLTEDKERIPVTLSAGLATYPTIGTGAENLLKLADEALYQAKNSGRNKVCVAEKAC